MPCEAVLISDMIPPRAEAAVKGALERFYKSDAISEIWPVALSAGPTGRLPLEQIEIVVLPLDRIGAPAGASGARVYVAYYSHTGAATPQLAASRPLVVKVGTADKLTEERDGADKWPKLSRFEESRFARPLLLDTADADYAILLAPFQSLSRLADGGRRNDIEVQDLWRLLEEKTELLPGKSPDWTKIGALVGKALDAMDPAHRCGFAEPKAEEAEYAVQYAWYLRKTVQDGDESAKYIPNSIFGEGATTLAFGRSWTNPTSIVRRIIDQRMRFTGRLGAVHGDLHPKNIVIGEHDAVQIIDFGWAAVKKHIVLDYVLLDLNLRGTTMPSQVSEHAILKLAECLRPGDDLDALPSAVRERARIIQDVIWKRVRQRALVGDWDREYLVPLFLVGYGLLVYLDNARNQPALVATVLQLANDLDRFIPTVPAP